MENLKTAAFLISFYYITEYLSSILKNSLIDKKINLIDYCHEVLNCDRDEQKWQIFQDLVTSCGWFFPYEKTVLMCDR